MARLIVVGAGGHATSCADLALSAGYGSLAFVDAQKAGHSLLGFPVYGRVEDVPATSQGGEFLVAIGDNASRMRVANELIAAFPTARFPALVHRTAFVSPFATIGAGAIVLAGSIVGPAANIGQFCIVNTRASIDHDCQLGDFSSFAPGAVCGGAVRVGARSAISIGAVVRHGVEIGADTVVGANSYVHRSLPALVLCFGSPAVVQRSRRPDEPYL